MCPFYRLESHGALLYPAGAPSEHHRCVAIEGPRVLSLQQQELMCVRSAHVDCPRYRRAVPLAGSPSRAPTATPVLPRAIAASLLVLALSAGVSFGFVVARGGIDLPSSPIPSPVAAVPTASAPPSTPVPTGLPTGAPTPGATVPPTAPPTEAPTAAAVSPTPEPTVGPSATSSSAPAGPSASRLAVLKPCPAQTGCYVYAVRPGDNLFSIAHWFGVPLDTVYAWNPTLRTAGIQAGMQIRIPTPTR